jgi:hypothetical protein
LSDLVQVAERLRQAKAAQRRFLGLWMVEEALILPGLDRVAADIYGAGRTAGTRGSKGPPDNRQSPEGM